MFKAWILVLIVNKTTEANKGSVIFCYFIWQYNILHIQGIMKNSQAPISSLNYSNYYLECPSYYLEYLNDYLVYLVGFYKYQN